MVSRDSSLDTFYKPGIFSNNDKVTIKFKEETNLNLKQMVCWPDTLTETKEFIKKNLNISEAPNFNKGFVNDKNSIWRIEPLKWWILDKKIESIDPILGNILDISHSRTHLSVYGKNSSILLNKHLPIDLRDKSFPVNSVASTSFHHVSITLCKVNDGFEIFIPRAFSSSLFEILLESSKQSYK